MTSHKPSYTRIGTKTLINHRTKNSVFIYEWSITFWHPCNRYSLFCQEFCTFQILTHKWSFNKKQSRKLTKFSCFIFFMTSTSFRISSFFGCLLRLISFTATMRPVAFSLAIKTVPDALKISIKDHSEKIKWVGWNECDVSYFFHF